MLLAIKASTWKPFICGWYGPLHSEASMPNPSEWEPIIIPRSCLHTASGSCIYARRATVPSCSLCKPNFRRNSLHARCHRGHITQAEERKDIFILKRTQLFKSIKPPTQISTEEVNKEPPSRSQVRRSSNLNTRRNTNILNNDSIPTRSSNTNSNRISTKPRRVLEEVIRGTGSTLPRATTISANIQRSDSLIGINNLHREPVRRSTLLVLELEGSVQITRDVRPVDINDTG